MSVEHLPYDQIAWKASHNSIDRGSITDQLSGAGLTEPCRGLELDLVQDDGAFRWRVQHGVRDDGPDFAAVLDEIVAWAGPAARADHPVLTVHLDLKNAPLRHEDFAQAIDALLVDRLGRRRLRSPRHLIRDAPDLVRGVRAGGWPTFAELRGTMVFCLSGAAERKAAYADFRPRERVCFADYAGSRAIPKTGTRIFANLFCEAAGYRDSLRRYRAAPGFVARGYNIARRRLWDLSEREGANLLATDVLARSEFSLGGAGFAAIP